MATAQQIVLSNGTALSRWVGIPASVWVEALGGRVFVGDATAGGRVFLWGEDASDAGNGVNFEAITAYSPFRSPGRIKRVTQVQVIVRDTTDAVLNVQVLRDWEVPASFADAAGPDAPPPSLPTLADGRSYLIWDVGSWDVDLWAPRGNSIGGFAGGTVTSSWRGATAIGQAFAVRLYGTSGNGRPAWLASNVAVEAGGPTA